MGQSLVKLLLNKCDVITKDSLWSEILKNASPEYLEMRAKEELSRAQQCVKEQDFIPYEKHLVTCTQLLTLARLKRQTYLVYNKTDNIIMTKDGFILGDKKAVLDKRREQAQMERFEIPTPIMNNDVIRLTDK